MTSGRLSSWIDIVRGCLEIYSTLRRNLPLAPALRLSLAQSSPARKLNLAAPHYHSADENFTTCRRPPAARLRARGLWNYTPRRKIKSAPRETPFARRLRLPVADYSGSSVIMWAGATWTGAAATHLICNVVGQSHTYLFTYPTRWGNTTLLVSFCVTRRLLDLWQSSDNCRCQRAIY